jgi:predicted phosphohydrolase
MLLHGLNHRFLRLSTNKSFVQATKSQSLLMATYSDISGCKNPETFSEMVTIHGDTVLSRVVCGHTFDMNYTVYYDSYTATVFST